LSVAVLAAAAAAEVSRSLIFSIITSKLLNSQTLLGAGQA